MVSISGDTPRNGLQEEGAPADARPAGRPPTRLVPFTGSSSSGPREPQFARRLNTPHNVATTWVVRLDEVP